MPANQRRAWCTTSEEPFPIAGPVHLGQHHIHDQDLWAKNLAEYDEAGMPAGYANPISYIATDRSRAFCLRTGPSVDGLRPWLDAATSGARNEYWEVDPTAEGTVGIPQ